MLQANTSGQGADARVPEEIEGFNWGAFLLHWIWGIGNNTFIALLAFVPLVNLVIPFVLGFRGNAWAWRNKRWHSVEEFRTIQRAWAKWGFIVYAAFFLMIGLLFTVLVASMRNSYAYQASWRALRDDDEAIALLGRPIDPGWPMGSIETSPGRGYASLSYSVEGSKGSGRVHAVARHQGDDWRIDEAWLVDDASDTVIDLND